MAPSSLSSSCCWRWSRLLSLGAVIMVATITPSVAWVSSGGPFFAGRSSASSSRSTPALSMKAKEPASGPPSPLKASKAVPSSTSPAPTKKATAAGPLSTIFEVYTKNTAEGKTVAGTTKEPPREDRRYTLITGLPLKPYFERKTVRYQVTPDIWTFEQPQGFFNVTTSVRMTVVRLENGDLWVHDPIAPTKECLRLLSEIPGKVAYIVLATTGFEHKVFVRDFANQFPKAKVYAAPDQWSWPINLPPPFRVDATLKDSDDNTPWAGQIEQLLFRPPVIGIGPANECVFFHKKSKTLICTDLVVFIKSTEPVAVADVTDLLLAAREDENERVPADSPAARNRGWARMALQILFLGPTTFSTFKLVSDRLLVSPVIQTFVFSKIPTPVAEFVNRITSQWAFEQVIPAHFNAPAKARPRDLQQAYAFVYEQSGVKPAKPAATDGSKGGQRPFWEVFLSPSAAAGGALKKSATYPASDMATLDAVNRFIVSVGVANQ